MLLTSGLLGLRATSLLTAARQLVTVLGIETSCDDTGCGIVTSDRKILGESLSSQTVLSSRFGGVAPIIATDGHMEAIDYVVEEALTSSDCKAADLDAIAVTYAPGLRSCLAVGLNKAKELARLYNLPLIPVHHMRAHALTARLTHDVEFPYLCLLASGGHCILATVTNPDDFSLLGTAENTAPGEMYDKLARSLKLHAQPEMEVLAGGAAVERTALTGDPMAIDLPRIMISHRHCDFGFAGLLTQANKLMSREKLKAGVLSSSYVANLCASFQLGVVRHLGTRLLRAMTYCEGSGVDTKTLVFAGGVASNTFVRSCLEEICYSRGYSLVCPPAQLCRDNGVMIAWAGVEQLIHSGGLPDAAAMVAIEPLNRLPIGLDVRGDLLSLSIKNEQFKFSCEMS